MNPPLEAAGHLPALPRRSRLAYPFRSPSPALALALLAFFFSLSAGWVIPAQGPPVYLAGFFAVALVLFVRIAEPSAGWNESVHQFRPLVYAFWGFAAWTAVQWTLASSWRERTETVLGWFLSALVLSTLLRLRRLGWGPIAQLAVLAALPALAAGFYQHFAAIGLYRKNFVGWFAGAASVPVIGFFGHPNDFADYLSWPLLVAVGIAFEYHGWRRAVFLGIALLLGIVLVWTYSRAAVLAVLFSVVIWLEARFLLRKRDFLIGLALLAGLVSAGLLWAINQYSAREFLSGRLRLWTLAMRDILRGPDFLVAGYLSVPPRGLNVFYYPHNIYLLAWTMYGLVGLAALAALAVFVLGLGWRRYRELRDQPTFASLWAGMVGLFLVNGMANFYFQETFHQLMFVTALLLMLGLNPSSPARSPVSNSPATGGPL